MPANGTSALDTLAWGTGLAETTSTLGVDRQDVRTPPDTNHIWALQISQCKNLLLTMSAYFKGGARVQLLQQSSNPFATSESGLYMDTSGNVYKVVNGTPTALGSGGGGVTWPLTNGTSANTYTSALADSGTSSAHIFDTPAYSTSGDKLISIRNNTVEKAYFGSDGSLYTPSIRSTGSTLSLYESPTGASAYVGDDGFGDVRIGQTSGAYIDFSANPHFYAPSGYLLPVSAMAIGTDTYPLGGVDSNWYRTPVGSQLTAAATITPTVGVHHVTGATSIATIAVTNLNSSSYLTLIADSAITWLATGNIAVAGTLTTGQLQLFFYDQATSKWYPQK